MRKKKKNQDRARNCGIWGVFIAAKKKIETQTFSTLPSFGGEIIRVIRAAGKRALLLVCWILITHYPGRHSSHASSCRESTVSSSSLLFQHHLASSLELPPLLEFMQSTNRAQDRIASKLPIYATWWDKFNMRCVPPTPPPCKRRYLPISKGY